MTPPRNETPEQRRLRLDRKNVAKRKARSEQTPEQRRQRNERANALLKQRRAEKRASLKANSLSEGGKEPQQRRPERARKSEWQKKRLLKETPEERQRRLEKGRARMRKSRLLEKERRAAKGKEGEEELRIFRQKKKFYNLTRRLTMTEEQKEALQRKQFFYRQANKERLLLSCLPEEEKEARRERQRNYLKNLTGERKQRYQESVARATKKQFEKMRADPEKWKKFHEKQLAYQRARYAKETEKQKLRRRRKETIYHAKRRRRTELEEENAPPEEIEKELNELGRRMWAEFYPGEEPSSRNKGGRRRKTRENSAASGGSLERKCFEEEPRQEGLEDAGGNQGGMIVEDTPGYSPVSSPLQKPEEDPLTPRDSCLGSPVLSPPSSPPGDDEVVDAIPEYSPDVETPECPHCTLTFFCPTDLTTHLVSSHADKCWKCPRCAQVFPSSSHLGEHYTSAHKNIRAQQDGAALPTDPTSTSPAQYPFFCLKCPPGSLQAFKTRKKLFEHVKQQHSNHFWPCRDCRLLKYSERALNLHHLICRSSSK